MRDVYERIACEMTLVESVPMMQTCTEAYMAVHPHVHEKKSLVREIPTVLFRVFSMSELMNATVLPYKQSFTGETGYVDGVRHSDLPEGLGIGRDCHGRCFLTIHKYHMTVTVFQRYSMNPSYWKVGSEYLPWGGSAVDDDFCAVLRHWLRSGTAIQPSESNTIETQ